MVRLSDLSPSDREHMLAKPCPGFDSVPFAPAPALERARVALVSTAGLQLRGQTGFELQTSDYRVIPRDTPAADLLMSHASTNFDRTGFQEDVNVVFPLTRLHELSAQGTIGSVAEFHYSFMGAFLDPHDYADSAREVAELLAADEVDVALLVPV